ncbi:MAG: GTP 3',8-cyclase MoaA [Desulfobacterales bacterium]|jgi:cyclic pyranopterin phosphate synthase|nr:GTP 3',8-cyclase MoaA [Desulfobacterales bacterium]
MNSTEEIPAQSKLIDRYGRCLSYIRISITDQCNLKCVYCDPFARTPKLNHEDILRYEEILRLVRIGANLGLSKVRVTGGEPLARKGVYDFLHQLCAIDALKDVSLTTNGVLLKDNIEKIKAAGIHRINISLDSLKRDKVKRITGYDVFNNVWDGIMAAHAMGFSPIKLNMVVIKGINDDELVDFAKLSLKYPFHIRFIEYMPIGNTAIRADQQLLADDMKRKLETVGPLAPIESNHLEGPAVRYRFQDAPGEIGLIRPISHHFCSTCNRLRLTAHGHLRVCLLSNLQLDIKTPMRQGLLDEALRGLFFKAVRLKPMHHSLGNDCSEHVAGQMSAIGG